MKEFDFELLKVIRKNKGKLFTQHYVANQLGVPLPTYRNWEQGVNTPNYQSILDLAEYFGVNPADFISFPDYLKDAKTDRLEAKEFVLVRGFNEVPVYDLITGIPDVDEDHILELLPAPSFWEINFFYKIQDDAMRYSGITSGALVGGQTHAEPENGDVALSILDNEKSIVSRIKKFPGILILQFDDPDYPDLDFIGDDVKRVSIFGKVTKVISEVK